MGDPKKSRKNYQRPPHPWQRERLDEERILQREYSLKNKKELWKANSVLRDFKYQTKTLASLQTQQAETEKINLIKKLQKYGLVPGNAHTDDILGLSIKNILDRRLQTLVHKKGLARTVKQARQFIVHRHIMVDGENIDVPGFMVPIAVEDKISFKQKSSLVDPEHPERVHAPTVVSAGAEKTEEKKEKVSVKHG